MIFLLTGTRASLQVFLRFKSLSKRQSAAEETHSRYRSSYGIDQRSRQWRYFFYINSVSSRVHLSFCAIFRHFAWKFFPRQTSFIFTAFSKFGHRFLLSARRKKYSRVNARMLGTVLSRHPLVASTFRRQ